MTRSEALVTVEEELLGMIVPEAPGIKLVGIMDPDSNYIKLC